MTDLPVQKSENNSLYDFHINKKIITHYETPLNDKLSQELEKMNNLEKIISLFKCLNCKNELNSKLFMKLKKCEHILCENCAKVSNENKSCIKCNSFLPSAEMIISIKLK